MENEDEQKVKILELMGYSGKHSYEPPRKMRNVLVSTNKDNRCPFCNQRLMLNDEIIKTFAYNYDRPDHEIVFPVSSCENCGMPIAQYSDLRHIVDDIHPYKLHIVLSKEYRSPYEAIVACYSLFCGNVKILGVQYFNGEDKEKLQDFKYHVNKWENGVPNLSDETRLRSLLLYSNKCSCTKCKKIWNQDTVKDQEAVVMTKTGEEVTINVQHCDSCGQFFMNYESFKAYENLYGALKLNVSFSRDVPEEQFETNFAVDSVLSRHGYSVRAGIPKTTRQKVLMRILDENVASKHEVIKLITQFIKINKYRFPDACRKWQEDIIFVNQYRIDEQANVGLLYLEQGGKIRK